MRFVLILPLLLALVACSGGEPAHSDYYVVTFEPAGAELAPEGQEALANAVAEVRRNSPSRVDIRAYADAADETLTEKRMTMVADALKSAGVPSSAINLRSEPTDQAGFRRLGDGIDVQLILGALPPATAAAQ